MFRRTLSAALLGLVLVVTMLGVVPTASAKIKIDNSIGAASAPKQTWKRGCKRYLIKWNLHPPTEEWSAKIQIYGPKGKRVHHILLDTFADPDKGQERYEMCGATIKPGRYAMQVTMLISEGRDNYYRRSEPTHFRIVKRRR